MSAAPARQNDDDLEPLTPEQRAAVEASRRPARAGDGGTCRSPAPRWMTEHFRVVWSKLALEDWHRLPAAVQGLIAASPTARPCRAAARVTLLVGRPRTPGGTPPASRL